MDTNKKAPDKAKLKQWLVMAIISVIFVGALYMILRPYLNKEDKGGNGQLITNVPDADVAKLPEDKLSAYKGSDLVSLDEEQVDPRLQRLYDEQDNADDSIEYANSRNPRREEYDPYEDEGYQSSQEMYAQFVREQEEEDRISRLEEQLVSLEREKQDLAEEREYLTQLGEIKDRQIAANDIYNNAYKPAPPAPAPEPPKDPNAPVSFDAVGAKTVDTSVVSTLSQSGREASSQQAHEALLQNRFTTSVGSLRSEAVAKNTMRAIIDETKTIKLGDEVKMRLMEDIQIGSVMVPKGTIIVAKSNLSGNRLQLKVTSIEYKERIIGVDLSAFDLNGQEGLYVPLSAEAIGLKALGEGLAETATGGISIQQSGKDQILANVSNGLIRSGGNYLRSKAGEVKIKIKAGYQLYLYDKSQQG
ncbi:conjugative transposon protein TraM [uncultured Porphyromonas sp.]|uniref:conjugative transposon protein TraM n=1 Tax=uncultured Porphyromonas sp. TaxID=159274 RepID=UPI00261FEF33|nr:conjugative transposon protein TraM [uncultured Porphyromonas sp.]